MRVLMPSQVALMITCVLCSFWSRHENSLQKYTLHNHHTPRTQTSQAISSCEGTTHYSNFPESEAKATCSLYMFNSEVSAMCSAS